MNFQHSGLKLIEVKLTSISRLEYFKNNTFLQGKKVCRIVTLNSGNATYTADGNTVIPADRSISAYLTLKDMQGKIIYDRIPYDEFNRKILAGIVPILPDVVIDWDNSFIELGQAIASGTVYAVLGVYYKD